MTKETPPYYINLVINVSPIYSDCGYIRINTVLHVKHSRIISKDWKMSEFWHFTAIFLFIGCVHTRTSFKASCLNFWVVNIGFICKIVDRSDRLVATWTFVFARLKWKPTIILPFFRATVTWVKQTLFSRIWTLLVTRSSKGNCRTLTIGSYMTVKFSQTISIAEITVIPASQLSWVIRTGITILCKSNLYCEKCKNFHRKGYTI